MIFYHNHVIKAMFLSCLATDICVGLGRDGLQINLMAWSLFIHLGFSCQEKVIYSFGI